MKFKHDFYQFLKSQINHLINRPYNHVLSLLLLLLLSVVDVGLECGHHRLNHVLVHALGAQHTRRVQVEHEGTPGVTQAVIYLFYRSAFCAVCLALDDKPMPKLTAQSMPNPKLKSHTRCGIEFSFQFSCTDLAASGASRKDDE